MMRRGFGGHPYGRDPSVAEERKTGRAGDFFDPVKETGSETALRDNSFEPAKRV